MSITIYGRHTSYNVQKVLWLLAKLDPDYTHIEFDSRPEDTESAEFGQLNPMRKVPALIDDDRVIWESNSILRYLARCYGENHWLPQDPYQASLVERWMDWAQTRFEPAFVGVFWGYYRTPESMRDLAAIENSRNECINCLQILDERLDNHRYLIDNDPTLADIAVAVFLYRLINIGLDVTLPARVKSWYRLIKKTAGYQQWVMSDFSILKGRLQY